MIEIRVLLYSKIEINFFVQKFWKHFKLNRHVFFRHIFINFQIEHTLNLLKMCFHVEIQIEKFKIYHYFFVVDVFVIFLILNQFFLAVVFMNYNYREDEIYVICINFELICFVVMKIMNHFDKLNIDCDKMYDKFFFKRFCNFF